MSIEFNSLISLSAFGKKVKSIYINGNKVKFPKSLESTELCFTSVDAGAVVQLKCNGTNLKSKITQFQVSTDGQNWTDHSFDIYGMLVNSGTSTEFVLPNIGDKIYFKAKTDNTGITRDLSNYLQFTTTQDAKLVDVSGNVMSLLSPEFKNLKQVGSLQFYHLFYQNKSIRECDKLILPATTLANQCYYNMFQDCSSLASAPNILPAKTLADYCYDSMFQGCSSLTSAPKFYAETLTNQCYHWMFYNCTSLESAPTLSVETLANECYSGMFQNCTSLTSAPELPAQTLTQSCYSGMFNGCSSLTSAPALPAKTIAKYCYGNMFNGCSSLSSAPELPAQTLADYCYYYMFQGCSSLTSIPELPATTLTKFCYFNMFEGCTSLSVSEQPKEGRIEWTIPSNAITATNWNLDMFTNTGGDFTSNPVPGVKYYIGEGEQDKKLVLKSVNGVECNFDPNDDMIARKLTYKNIDGVIQQPYSSNPEISGTNSVAEVYDSGDLSSVGAYSFRDCSNLSSIYLKGATEIRHNAFYKCTGLKTVDIPEVSALMTIDSSGVFYDCYNLSSINCPKLKRADNGSFNGCKSLISIDIPEVQKLDTYVFQRCDSLSSVNIPNTTRLETYCFMNCSSLVSLEIPKVSYIGGFNHCPSLSVLDFSEKTDDTIPTLNNVNLIRNEINPDFRIIIPERLYDNWISANQWNIISSHIEKATTI